MPFAHLLIESQFKFVLPYAPLTMGTGSYGWWPVDFLAVQERAKSGNLEKFMIETPRGLVRILKFPYFQLPNCDT